MPADSTRLLGNLLDCVDFAGARDDQVPTCHLTPKLPTSEFSRTLPLPIEVVEVVEVSIFTKVVHEPGSVERVGFPVGTHGRELWRAVIGSGPVDSTPPDTTITAGPGEGAIVPGSSVTFSFAGTAGDTAKLQCSFGRRSVCRLRLAAHIPRTGCWQPHCCVPSCGCSREQRPDPGLAIVHCANHPSFATANLTTGH